MTTHVTETPAAASDVALCHFEDMLAFETDCWDVHESLKSAEPDFIVVDVRGPASFAKGHVRGAINIPHREITAQRMAEYSKGEVPSSSTAPAPIAMAPTRLRSASPALACP